MSKVRTACEVLMLGNCALGVYCYFTDDVILACYHMIVATFIMTALCRDSQ